MTRSGLRRLPGLLGLLAALVEEGGGLCLVLLAHDLDTVETAHSAPRTASPSRTAVRSSGRGPARSGQARPGASGPRHPLTRSRTRTTARPEAGERGRHPATRAT
ncbi:hypothetical protein FM076_02555 [Streptomyces albus subsp. chlorinus]|uniref:hypothetical protein n=1 Tax=Streptomyces albus TaxID=1888 RepID=UPI00156F98AA|nr:hypothetical protein [Streptomyces albus subsp. chlorinus]